MVGYLGITDMYSLVRRALTHSQVAIVMYHRVSPESHPWLGAALKPADFEKQIAYLRRVTEVMPLDSLVSRIMQGQSLPPKAVSITFDDGFKDNYTFAYPILRKYNLPATTFLTTGYIGSSDTFWDYKVRFAIWNTSVTRPEIDGLGYVGLNSLADRRRAVNRAIAYLMRLPEKEKHRLVQELLKALNVELPVKLGNGITLSWDDVLEMGKNGISFGAHTVTHPILTRLPIEEAREEVAVSKKDIEERLGQACTSFAYPYGDFNAEIMALIKECGFICALTGVPQLLTRGDNLFALPRISAGSNFYTLKGSFSGLYPDLASASSWFRRSRA